MSQNDPKPGSAKSGMKQSDRGQHQQQQSGQSGPQHGGSPAKPGQGNPQR